MSDLVERLRGACNGHPHAKIAWPHRILHEAAEVAAGRLVAIRCTTPDGAESYGLYPARVAAYVHQLLGAPTLPCDGLPVEVSTQGRADTQYYALEAWVAAMLALRAYMMATLRHNKRRLARNCAKIARLRGQEGGYAHA